MSVGICRRLCYLHFQIQNTADNILFLSNILLIENYKKNSNLKLFSSMIIIKMKKGEFNNHSSLLKKYKI